MPLTKSSQGAAFRSWSAPAALPPSDSFYTSHKGVGLSAKRAQARSVTVSTSQVPGSALSPCPLTRSRLASQATTSCKYDSV
jgi:hypothetical protein